MGGTCFLIKSLPILKATFSLSLIYLFIYFWKLDEVLCFFVLGGMMSLEVKSKTYDLVKCVVVDGGELKSRRHLNVRGKSATLPSITGN